MKEIRLSWNGHLIMAYENGEGNVPLVLLHGAGVDSAMLSWREVMEALPERYVSYAVDLPGYGQSDSPDGMRGDGFYKKHLSALESVVEQLGLKRFALSGLSMGGAIAIGYALKHPEQVSALIPVDSWGLVNKMPMHGLYYWYIHTSMPEHTYRMMAGHRWLIRWSLSASMIADRKKISEALVDELSELCRKPGADRTMVDYQRSSLKKCSAIPHYTGLFNRLTMPTLYINGEKDAFVRAKDSAAAAAGTPNARLHIMKSCKHWPQKERPLEYVKEVDGLIASLTGSASEG